MLGTGLVPCHYLNHCWLIDNWTLSNKHQRNSNQNVIFIQEMHFKMSSTTCQHFFSPQCVNPLTHWGRDKMAVIFQTTFSNAFSWMKMNEFRLKISLKFVPKGQINNIPSLYQIMAWRRSGDKPLSDAMMVSLLTHICVTRPQWVKTLESKCQSGTN